MATPSSRQLPLPSSVTVEYCSAPLDDSASVWFVAFEPAATVVEVVASPAAEDVPPVERRPDRLLSEEAVGALDVPAVAVGPVAVTVMVAPPIALPRLSVMAPDKPPAAGVSFTATSTFGVLPSICSTWLDTSKPGRKTVSRYRPGDEPMSLNRKRPSASVEVRCGGATAAAERRTEVNAANLVGSSGGVVVPSEIGSRTADVPTRSEGPSTVPITAMGTWVRADAPPSPPAPPAEPPAPPVPSAPVPPAPPRLPHRRIRHCPIRRSGCRCRPRCWRPTRARWPASATGCSATPDR